MLGLLDASRQLPQCEQRFVVRVGERQRLAGVGGFHEPVRVRDDQIGRPADDVLDLLGRKAQRGVVIDEQHLLGPRMVDAVEDVQQVLRRRQCRRRWGAHDQHQVSHVDRRQVVLRKGGSGVDQHLVDALPEAVDRGLDGRQRHQLSVLGAIGRDHDLNAECVAADELGEEGLVDLLGGVGGEVDERKPRNQLEQPRGVSELEVEVQERDPRGGGRHQQAGQVDRDGGGAGATPRVQEEHHLAETALAGVGALAGEELLQLDGQDVEVDRLRHVVVGAGGVAGEHVGRVLQGRDDDDRDARGGVVRAQPPGQLEPAHAGHGDIGENQVRRPLPDQVQSLQAVRRQPHVITAAGQELAQERPAGAVVLGDDDGLSSHVVSRRL